MSAEAARILELMTWVNWIKPFFSTLMDKHKHKLLHQLQQQSLPAVFKTNKDVSFSYTCIKISSFFQILIPFSSNFKKRKETLPLSLFSFAPSEDSLLGHTKIM